MKKKDEKQVKIKQIKNELKFGLKCNMIGSFET